MADPPLQFVGHTDSHPQPCKQKGGVQLSQGAASSNHGSKMFDNGNTDLWHLDCPGYLLNDWDHAPLLHRCYGKFCPSLCLHVV
eukprot:2373351-Amphidinium_carterae.1